MSNTYPQPIASNGTYHEYTVLDSLIDLQLVDVDIPCLPKPMGTIKCLILRPGKISTNKLPKVLTNLKCRIPPHVNKDHIITRGQIEAWDET